jgi:hypothetical protein
MLDVIQPLINQFMPFAKKRMGFSNPPRLFLRSDVGNADNPLGKTAYYDPSEHKIVLYVTGRHPKDVMRSLSHELVHHTQNLRGDFDNVQAMGDGYAQNDAHLREMEREAYEMGNLCFRDWEDSIKHTIYFEHLHKGVATVMSTKDWKNKEIQGLLSEAWGFKMNLDALTEAAKPDFPDIDGDGDTEEPISKAAEDKKAKEGGKKEKEDDDKEKMDEGSCPSMDHGDDDMMMDRMSVEDKLNMILDKLGALMGAGEMAPMAMAPMMEEDKEEIEEVSTDDSRKRPAQEQKLREAVRKALKASIKKA